MLEIQPNACGVADIACPSFQPTHAFGVDDGPPILSVLDLVPGVGHFSRALLVTLAERRREKRAEWSKAVT